MKIIEIFFLQNSYLENWQCEQNQPNMLFLNIV